MKKLTLTIAIGLILFTSCSKDESLEQTELQTTDSVYVLNQFNNAATWDTVLLDSPISNSIYFDNRTTHTEGHYQPNNRNEMTITWSGTQNENGARGSAEIIQITPNFSFYFILKTECIMAEGDEAVYGGTITQVRELSGNAPEIGVGWRFYFKVTDYGQGGNITNDLVANTTVFASPMSPSLCDVYVPNHPIWYSSGSSEVTSPGYVIVDSNVTD